MISALPENMPVFLDKLRLSSGSESEQRFFEYLRTCYPELESRFRAMMLEGTDPYYAELKEIYQDEPRIKFVFGES
jgi:hypothetical protein